MRVVFAFIYIFLFHFTSQAQDKLFTQKFSFGFWVGTAAYVGDITPSYPNMYQIQRPAAGIYNRINFNPRLALKTSINAGTLYGADEMSDNVYNQLRNLSFRTRIYDVTTQFEFNFFEYILNSEHDNFTPFAFIGISGFYFNPQALLNDEWINLQPLGTEGQQFPQYSGRDPYSRFSWSFTYGGGMKFSISRGFTMGIEVGYRETKTDYLDDISTTYVDNDVIAAGTNGANAAALADRSAQVAGEPIGLPGRERGNPETNDHYLFTGINMAFTIRNFQCPTPSNSLFEKW